MLQIKNRPQFVTQKKELSILTLAFGLGHTAGAFRDTLAKRM